MAAPMSHVVKFACVRQLRNVYRLSTFSHQQTKNVSAVTNHLLNALYEPKSAVLEQNWSLFERSQLRYYSGQTVEETERDAAKEQSATGTSPELTEKEKILTGENAALKEKVDDLEDKYKRSLAETENVRHRMQKQVDDSKLFAIQGFCKDLLDVADVLQKATDSVPKEELEKGNEYLKGLYNGLVITEKELQSVFSRQGVVSLDPVDEKFDPNCHEAIFYQPFPGKTPGHVAVVTKIGYKLHGRTIRPAIVGVVKEG